MGIRRLDQGVINAILDRESRLRSFRDIDNATLSELSKIENPGLGHLKYDWGVDHYMRQQKKLKKWKADKKSEQERRPLPIEMLVAFAKCASMHPEVSAAFSDGQKLFSDEEYLHAEKTGMVPFVEKYGEDFGITGFHEHKSLYDWYSAYFWLKYCREYKKLPLFNVYYASTRVGTISELGDDRFLEVVIGYVLKPEIDIV